MKKRGDVKFIIYQSLYILVICIVAMKHATLDLIPVMEQKSDIISEDSLRKLYDQIKMMTMVDTTYFVIVPRELVEKSKEWQRIMEEKATWVPPVDMSGYVRLSSGERITKVSEEVEQKYKDVSPEEIKKQELNVGDIILYQYHDNSVRNSGDFAITINGVSIPAHSSGTVRCSGEGSVMVTSAAGASRNVSTRENKPPQIQVQQMATMGADARISSLQSTVGFRVTVTDDFPDQVEVSISGPISKKEAGSKVYDIYLNYIHSKDEFDRFTQTRGDPPYQVAFTVTVTDRIAPHKVSRSIPFVFGDW